MMFFLVLFLTSWSIALWLEPATLQGRSYPFLSTAALVIIIALLLASARTIRLEKNRIRRIKDKKLVEVVTKSNYPRERIIPNKYFWVLIIMETIMIIMGYVLGSNTVIL
jgi:hypothetical protein